MKISQVEAFQVAWAPDDPPPQRSAFVRITTNEGLQGVGEASPMRGGGAALFVVEREMAPQLIGRDPLEHAVIYEQLLHRCVKLGPEGIITSALAAIDIALWDLKGKILGLPIHKLLGGAWRNTMPLYSSIGGNGDRTLDDVLRIVERRVCAEKPALVKIRFDSPRTRLDADIAGDIAKARAVRGLVGPDFPLAFDANNGFSVGGAIRVGRALEELGFLWFEEPVQHYHVKAMGEVAQRLNILVAAGEQTYTLQGLVQLIDAGVRMVQPDIVKMGGITGMTQCAALAHGLGVDLVPHQTQPTIATAANLHVLSTVMHLTKPVEWNSGAERMYPVFLQVPRPIDGHFTLPESAGLGVALDEAALAARRVAI